VCVCVCVCVCVSEIPRQNFLNNQDTLLRTKNKKVKQVLSGSGTSGRGRGEINGEGDGGLIS
jgi:hypothetical protein